MTNSTIGSQLKAVSNLLEEAQQMIQSLENMEAAVDEPKLQTLKNYQDHKDHIEDDIYESEKCEDVLLGYDSFDVSIFQSFIDLEMKSLFKNEQIMKHIIDHMDLEIMDNENWRPIHYVCNFSTPEMIKYIVEKGVDLEAETNDHWRPIHYVCNHSTSEIIRYIVEKGVDLEAETDDNWRPIHIVCKRCDAEMVRYFYEKKVNTDCKTEDGLTPLDIFLEAKFL